MFSAAGKMHGDLQKSVKDCHVAAQLVLVYRLRDTLAEIVRMRVHVRAFAAGFCWRLTPNPPPPINRLTGVFS